MNTPAEPIVDATEHEPACDGTGQYHGRHDCRFSGEPEAGCFAFCEDCA